MSFRIPRLRRKAKFSHIQRMASPSPQASRPKVESADRDIIAGPDEDPSDTTMKLPPVPSLFTSLPPIKDDLKTESSEIQGEIAQECLGFMSLQHVEDPQELNSFGVPRLQRERHIRFLKQFEHGYPAPFVAADSTRPWMVYWGVAGLGMLGEDINKYKDR
jgi:protein farnesyltransferase subunit beta